MLLQEATRYNDLLKIVQSTLQALSKALKGFVVMSEQLELMAASLFHNEVPANWQSKSYSSLKPLGKQLSASLCRCYYFYLCYSSLKPDIVINEYVFTLISFLVPRSKGTNQVYKRLAGPGYTARILDVRILLSSNFPNWHVAKLRAQTRSIH